MRHGVLLINLGTPDNTSTWAIVRYLREFLSDKRVITLPGVLRYILLYALILPFRTKKITRAYEAIWTSNGSPLRHYSLQLCALLQEHLGENYHVVLGMRYGNPSLADALSLLKNCSTLTILPLYPQYSSAATGSSLAYVLQLLSKQINIPSLNIIRDFYQHPSFIHAQTQQVRAYIQGDEFILFSYHGLPTQHLIDSGCHNACTQACPATVSTTCYRAQCFETTRQIVKQLGLHEDQYATSFQSRLGKTPWIQPYTDQMLTTLADRGIKKLLIVCPSFVADCLETLEEIDQQAKKQWKALGGTHFICVPSMNDNQAWVHALSHILSHTQD